MKCTLCGFQFNENEARVSCSGCGMMIKCGLVKCPNCNFETLPDPEWIKKLINRRRKEDGVN